MVFLRWVRTGVLTFSVLLSACVLALSALLIYTRSTSPLIYDDLDGPMENDNDFVRDGINRLLSSITGNTRTANADGDIYLRPSGHDVDTVLTTSVAIINILTVPMLLLADLFKRKTWLSTLVVEAGWLFVLWSLWLTCGAYTAWCSQTSIVNFIRCQSSPSECLQYKFVEIFSFINWIILMLYANTLFTIAVINHKRRHPIWFARVRDAPRLPPIVFAAQPPLSFDESKARSLMLSTSSSSLLHHTPYSTRHPHSHILQSSNPHSPLLPSIDEASVVPSTPSIENHAHTLSRPDTESMLPPLYSERPDLHAPI